MNGIRPSLRASIKRVAAIAAVLAATAATVAGCHPAPSMRLHYLPGFVPGSERVFRPVHVAILPADGEDARGRVLVGAIYASDGTVDRKLYVEDLGNTVTRAVVEALTDAGLTPVAITTRHRGATTLPAGTDFMLTTTIEEASINKRFGDQRTVHGQYFVMNAKVRIRFALSSRAVPDLYSGEMIGTEEEPPAPVGHEVFLPLETEPQESMSVALSRAVGALLLQTGFRAALPLLQPVGPAATGVVPPTPAPPHR